MTIFYNGIKREPALISTELLLFVFLLMAAGPSFAAGLSLYSYRDDQGQQIVVDSLERVPEQYRDQAQKSFIPSFRPSKPKPADQVEPEARIGTSEPRIEVISAPEVIKSRVKHDLKIMEPPPEREPPDPGLATAALIISDMETVIGNFENIYSLAFNYSIKHPAVLHHHLTNVNLLRQIVNPSSVVFREPGNWGAEAAVSLERLRTIQYTISAWMQTSTSPMLTTLPTLTEAARRNSRHISEILQAMKKADAERIEENFRKAELAWKKRNSDD
ncbi:MAG TPA: hypothetical protein PLM07_15715 [Candidatus Rifleibacterium sp.]|nr:hypothetical protein [Candidatus Rifleibacterium sp.]HPT47328.1 hypothetical protein [Candidatus Rifleibacterium sp.]